MLTKSTQFPRLKRRHFEYRRCGPARARMLDIMNISYITSVSHLVSENTEPGLSWYWSM